MARSLAVITGLMIVVSSAALAAGASLKAADIVVPDNLGAQISWLESQIGPAFKIDGDNRTYKLQGCRLDVITVKNEILGFAVEVSKACAFDLKAFTASEELPAPGDLTFGSFEAAAGPAEYFADCISMCGNAFAPAVYAFRPGSQADKLVNIMLEVKLIDDAAVDASLKWADAMKAKEGEDYVIDTKFNCERKYSDLAHHLFKAVKPTRITVGMVDEPRINTNCPGGKG